MRLSEPAHCPVDPGSPAMIAADSIEGFLADPRGRYFASPSFLAWATDRNLVGCVLLGCLDARHLPHLEGVGDLSRCAMLAPPLDALIDASAVTGVAPAIYEALSEGVARAAERANLFRRVAVVQPAGVA